MTLDKLIQDFKSAQTALDNAIRVDDVNAVRKHDGLVCDSFQNLLDYSPENVNSAVRLTKILIDAIPGADQTSKITQAIQTKLVEIVERAGTYPDS